MPPSQLIRSFVFTALVFSWNATGQRFFETEPINYGQNPPVDAVSAYFAHPKNLEGWERAGPSGYLKAFLEAFDIPASSQTLVFSKTSLQAARIHPRNPRALYFNDEIYVGWVPSGNLLEISVTSPHSGTNFYTLDNIEATPVLVRETHDCLRCHGGSMTRDTPGHVVRSVFPDETGQPIFKAGTTLVDQSTPIEKRWGGWLVTGSSVTHQGNQIFAETSYGAERSESFNLEDVPDRGYLHNGSDIVAHLLLTHQATLHTQLAALSINTRRALHDQRIMDELLGRQEALSDSTRRRIKHAADAVLKTMFFVDEASLPKIDYKQSPFAQEFEKRGPRDSHDHSLFQLLMNRRMLRNPFSYLVYSNAFNQLPQEALDYLWPEIGRILDSDENYPGFEHLSTRDKRVVRQILLETHPAARQHWQ